jgi:lycopene beta-cyclase
MNRTNHECFDYVLVGGGLQSGLLALAIKHYHPEASVLLLERDSKLAGNHTWSYHPGDVPQTCRGWMQPLADYRWSAYEVRLGSFRTRVDLNYATVSSEHFARVITDLFDASPLRGKHPFAATSAVAGKELHGRDLDSSTLVREPRRIGMESLWELRTLMHVDRIDAHTVHTQSGETFQGRLVIDCRGKIGQNVRFTGSGFQKFHGFEVLLDRDWTCDVPIVMDSVADQRDGFRFIYTLPFTPRRILVEDTRFSNTPDMDRHESWDLVSRYLESHGFTLVDTVREESGVLPMPFSPELLPAASSPLAGGYAGGWFHAATGYSFPLAVAYADAVASGPIDAARLRLERLADKHRWRANFARFLNRLLFRLVAPKYRPTIFRRFYRVLSPEAIERFYSHNFTAIDAMRIVVGMPPTVLGLRPGTFLRSFFQGPSS